MIEFISLCVCSACLSYICCLITGGLCLMPCCSRLRLKMMKKHFSEDLNCLGIESPSGISDTDTTGSESSLIIGDSARAEKSSRRKSNEKNGRKCSKGCPGIGEATSKKRLQNNKSKSNNKRWTFCLNLKRPPGDPESKKKSKKSRRDRRNDSETHCAYFKSCSCTNVKRKSRRRRSEPSATKSPTEGFAGVDEKRARKQEKKSGKQCPCEILARYDNVVCYDSRDLRTCKCCAQRSLAASRRC